MNPFREQMHRFFDHLHRHPGQRGHAGRHGHGGHHFGRHGGRHHPGFFGFDAGIEGGRVPGRGGFGRGRKLGSNDLQLLLLALLAEKPSHGYELIKALDERSNGYYSPSPGMVYPALTYLEEIGHASVQAEGTRKLYSVTDAGMKHLDSLRAEVDAMLEQLAWIGRRMDHVRRAMAGGSAAAGEDDLDAAQDRGGFGIELRRARRSLKSALIEKSGAAPDEQRRIADILERAAADIRGR